MAFVPRTELEKAVHGGYPDATLAWLRAATPAQRAAERASATKMNKLAMSSRWSKPPVEWGGRATDLQVRAASIAVVLCGLAEDVAESWIDGDLLLSLCAEFRPRALDGLAEALMAHSPQRIRHVSKLIGASLVERPDTEAYTLGLIALPHLTRTPDQLAAVFAADPGLRAVLPRVFDIEGTGDTSLSSSDKYSSAAMAWGPILLALVEDGLATRASLLDRTLGALEKDWPQYRAGWFSRFHGDLAPGVDEMRPHAARYLGLCASRIAPTVALALSELRKLDDAGALDDEALLAALPPVLAASVKGQVDAAMKLLDGVVGRVPARAPEAAALLVPALMHEAVAVQAGALKRLKAWGVESALRVRLAAAVDAVAATNRQALLALVGDVPADPAPVAAATPPARRAHPLDDDRRLTPPADLHELVDLIAHAFEHAEDVDAFERAIAGLAMAPPIAAADRPLFSPVLKRAAKVKALLPRELARLLRFVAAGESMAGSVSHDNGGNASPVDALLLARIDDLARSTIAGHRLEPLATPTHRGGVIAPERLAARWQAHVAAGAAPSIAEQERALLRLAPGPSPAALAAARGLADAAFTRALRYALGDDIAPGAERRLFAAAARIRHPGADDAALDRHHPGLGPDGALAARYAWHVESQTHEVDGKTYTHRDLVLEAQPPRARDAESPLAVQRHNVEGKARLWFRWWAFGGTDAGAVRYSATLLPSDLQAFFAEGARAFGNNLDWWEAQWQNSAYLEPLLDPTTPMTSMANLLLVVALAGKEPGQTAIAVDALVHAHAEGRIDGPALATTLRELLASPLLKAARLHKSLQAALRADPRLGDLVFELLGAAVQARPQDPPRDLALLLGLLLELQVAGRRALPAAARDALATTKLSGNGRTLQRQLLASE